MANSRRFPRRRGMGQVFKAQHRRMERIVAIKMLPRHVMRDPATVARFEREVKAAAKLRHASGLTVATTCVLYAAFPLPEHLAQHTSRRSAAGNSL